jgi:hypothetical protein
MTLLADIRPDEWNLALFVHVLGAMTLFGALVLVAVSLSAARGADSAAALRLGYRSLLLAAIPSWIAMRVGGQWIASEEGLDDPDVAPTWFDIGFITSEASLPLLIAATVCAGMAARRGRGRLSTAALVLVAITLVAYVVAIWMMTAKPS